MDSFGLFNAFHLLVVTKPAGKKKHHLTLQFPLSYTGDRVVFRHIVLVSRPAAVMFWFTFA